MVQLQEPASDRTTDRFADRAASALAYLLNPLIVPPFALGLLGVHAGAGKDAAIWIVTSASVIYVVLPGVMLYALKRSGRIHSFEIRNRRNRIIPMIGGIFFSLLAIPVVSLYAGAATDLVKLVATSLSVAAIAGAMLTFRVKLSLHAASYAGLFVLLTWITLFAQPTFIQPEFIQPTAGVSLSVRVNYVIISLLLIPVVAWGRLRCRAHTRTEVIVGIIFGLVTMAMSLYILGLAWPQIP